MTKTEIFIQKARETHGDAYDYSLTEYINWSTKVIITCPVHGNFTQRPNSHVARYGCPKCSWDKMSKSCSKTTDDFKLKAKQVHGDTYDYSLVNYTSAKSKVAIICSSHGEFSQRSGAHLDGQGCPMCGVKSSADKQTHNTELFIKKAKRVHGDTFDYSKVTYTKSRNKVTISCKIHGDFEQVANEHLKGRGCKECSRHLSLEHMFVLHKHTPTTFYIIKYKGLYKVGITIADVMKRYKSEVPDKENIEVISTKSFSSYESAYKYEQSIIVSNKMNRYIGDAIFKNTGNTEVFSKLN